MVAKLEERLDREPIAWLSTTRPDGRPHVVPVWFVWDGESIVVLSKPDAQKVRNVRDNPNVMLALGTPRDDFDVELVEGVAELVSEACEPCQGRLATKYEAAMERLGVTSQRFFETYRQAMRITPTRALGYGGTGW
jgi:PPOX class probable F420-dependent enzyme